MKPDFSIVIPTVNNLPGLNRLLTSFKSVEAIERSEILLIENPATGKISELAQRFPELVIRCFDCPAGVNRARNKGLQAALGELVFFFDDDCWLSDPRLLLKHQQKHQENSWAFAVGGFYRNQSSSALDQAYDEIQREWLLRNRLNEEGLCQMLLGGHFSMKKISPLPAFDESIVYGGAETEFFFRMKKEGYLFLLIQDSVEHEPHLTLSALAKKASLQGRTHRRMIREGLFQPSKWISQPQHQSGGYKALYSWFFNYRSLDRMTLPELKAPQNAWLKDLHQKICFYLENREHF